MILTHMLNVAVKQKRLSDNPCRAAEFPVSLAKSTRKPHYMSASEQTKIEFAAPNFLRNIVVILSEMGLRYKKELLPMKKTQVDLENALVHIADSKTAHGIGDILMTANAREAFRRQIAETPGSEYLFPARHRPAASRTSRMCESDGRLPLRKRVFRTSRFTSCGTLSLPG
jgi:integrase